MSNKAQVKREQSLRQYDNISWRKAEIETDQRTCITKFSIRTHKLGKQYREMNAYYDLQKQTKVFQKRGLYNGVLLERYGNKIIKFYGRVCKP